mmetsp:Transcript_24497/g.64636  ORF Transcript_24497/g.64636 Transcript_24497/m.64636 type:complete len:704 (-) Transcript_24497:138-2249(-)
MARLVLLLGLPLLTQGLCPGIAGAGSGGPPAGHPEVPRRLSSQPQGQGQPDYAAALERLDLSSVREDLEALMTRSQDFWPADYGHYGGLFVRQAWHCAGSYRASDGRGGCEGGHQRFEPERSWEDNTNLDKARALLWPIKEKYGPGLSWGDLIILAGTTAIQSMGGPVLGFCAGRVDSQDGAESLELGPSALQEELAPCAVNGTCASPLGTTTVGLIYVNPEGPMGRPSPSESAPQVRDVFLRMGMNDTETVALIGGGHAFGKAHGACTAGHGPSPNEDPRNPWPGLCGSGKGNDTFTSGFEGPWTTNPTVWDNQFFRNLLENDWVVHTGPGGHFQWKVKNPSGTLARIMMLTTDISLLHDDSYRQIVQEFTADQSKLDRAFAHAWYKLTTRDMGPVTRCSGPDVPPAQPFQYPLPPAPQSLADFSRVRGTVRDILRSSSYYHGALFVRLASRCASTFRATDHLGGCNGGRIRFSPQKDWHDNTGLDRALPLLEPVKERFGDGLSWADLIVLAGTVAAEEAGAPPMRFCGGRSDAVDGAGSEALQPKSYAGSNVTAAELRSQIVELKNQIRVMGLSYREFAALHGGGRSLGELHGEGGGFDGARTSDPTRLSSGYFGMLLAEEWEVYQVPGNGTWQYKAKGKDLLMLGVDLLFRYDAELLAIAQGYASDNGLFLRDFAAAWTKLMNADRFKGPTGNVCDDQDM